MGITVLSLFDGMSCGMIALERAGIKVDKYYACEIKPHAIEVSKDNYPDIIQLGDVTKLDVTKLDKIDLIIGGSPCQDLSRCNRTKLGLKGIKSGLFYEYVRILNECKAINPDIKFLLENVKMKTEWQNIISETLEIKPLKINSKIMSAQLRNRLYWTNIDVDLVIPENDVKLQSILEYGYTERDKSRCLLEGDSRPLTTPVKMFHRFRSTGFTTLIFKNKEHYLKCKEHYDANYKGMPASEIPTNDTNIYNGVRYLTQIELERLQTVKDGYTKALGRNKAACLLGDGWTVDIISFLLKNV